MSRIDARWHERLLPAHVCAAASRWQFSSMQPDLQSRMAVALFADVVGFTAMAERYSQSVSGIEILLDQVHQLFCSIEHQVIGRGGDIQQFAGDSILALWFADGETLDDCLLASLGAADAIHEASTHLGTSIAPALSLRVGVSAGVAHSTFVGGVQGRWHALTWGPAIARACAAASMAAPRRTVCDAATWDHHGKGVPARARHAGSDHVEVPDGLDRRMPWVDAAQRPREAPQGDVLARLIPISVLCRLNSLDPAHGTELRHVSCSFVRLGSNDTFEPSPSRLGALQEAVRATQQVVLDHEGMLARIGSDDKGLSVLAAWGVPGHLHDDDVARALAAATKAVGDLASLGLESRAGVTTGRVLAGLAGGQRRSEYTVHGRTVNVAAKLMHRQRSGVWCDEATRRGVDGGFEFQAEGEAPTTFRVSRLDQPARIARVVDAEVVGRREVRRHLAGLIGEARQGTFRVVLQGPAGIGKSVLVAEFVRHCEAAGHRILAAACDGIDGQTAYSLWPSVLAKILGISPRATPHDWAEVLQRRLSGWPELLAWLPVLRDVLPLEAVETPRTAASTHQGRAEAVQRIVRKLLQQVCEAGPVVLVVEDAHWVESRSWALVSNMIATLPGLSLLASSRGDIGPHGRGNLSLLSEGLQHIEVGALGPEETYDLVAVTVGADDVDPKFARDIFQASGGHPMLARELVRQLVAEGSATVQGNLVRATRPWSTPDVRGPVVASIEALVLQQVDRLSQASKALLGVGSLLGSETLEEIAPRLARDLGLDAIISTDLSDAASLGLVRPVAVGARKHHVFTHALVREIIYQSIPEGRRARLHAIVAAWLEECAKDELASSASVIAHHWARSDDEAMALRSSIRAADVAVQRYAHQEAARWLEHALARIDGINAESGAGPSTQRARCERLLGIACSNLGELEIAQAHLAKSFVPPARPYRAGVFGIAREVLHLLVCKLAASWVPRPVPPANREATASDAFATLRLSEMAYFNWDATGFLYAGLRGLNDAERSGNRRDLALWYVGIAGVAGTLHLSRTAERYVSKGLGIARALGDVNVMARVATFAAVCDASQGLFARAIDHAQMALQFSRACADGRRLEDALVCIGVIHYQLGNVDNTETAMRECLERGFERGDQQTVGWAYLGLAQVQLARSAPALALETLTSARARIADRLSRINLDGHAALALALLAEDERSQVAAQACLDAARGQPTSFSVLVGIVDATRALLNLWWRAEQGSDPRLEARVRAALRALRGFARVFPVGRPAAALYSGCRLWAMGRRQSARSQWLRALRIASRMEMPVEENLAAAALRASDGDDDAGVRAVVTAGRRRRGDAAPVHDHAPSTTMTGVSYAARVPSTNDEREDHESHA